MTNTKEQEVVWKQYPKYSFIEANQFGEVRIRDRYITYKNGNKRLIKGRLLKQHLNTNGYMYVNFRVNGKKINLRVNRIVATAFVPNPLGLPEVDHIDCDRTNNVASNLRWCTHKENIAHRDKLGHTAKHNAPKKPVIAVHLKSQKVFYFESQHEAARQSGAYVTHVNDVVKGEYNQTHGYWFCYADEYTVEKVRTKFGDEVANEVEKLINENCN